MTYKKQFELWKTDEFFDEKTRSELSLLTDETEIEDRFYQDLEFGTAGLRGIMGAGTNRMNKYTVGKATKGFGEYLLSTFGEELCKKRGVVISYDTRLNSAFFAECAASVFSTLGIKVLLFSAPRPIAELSFAIRKYHAVGGVMITASHNPKEYNGYKTYDKEGCQLVPDMAAEVTKFVNNVTNLHDINFKTNHKLIKYIDITNAYIKCILKQSIVKDKNVKKSIKLVYTPLHGTGFVPVLKTLKADAFKNINLVTQQCTPDGNFPTVALPNPEDRRALELGIKQAELLNADLVFGTDPDADRVGAAVKTEEGYKLLSGNQMGVLLMDFILNVSNISKLNKPAVINTIVTSELGAEIARKKNVMVFSTLTGFKFIGEKIMQFQQAKEQGDATRDYDFVFGYEESYGYLVGTHARDKDAIVTSMLIAEMAAYYKAYGKNFYERLYEIYDEYGYYLDTQDSITLKGKEGLKQIAGMMSKLKKSKSVFGEEYKMIDYNRPVKAEAGFGNLPAANVIKFVFNDGSFVVVRPSGTEPKIKIYYCIKGKTQKAAESRQAKLKKEIQKYLGL